LCNIGYPESQREGAVLIVPRADGFSQWFAAADAPRGSYRAALARLGSSFAAVDGFAAESVPYGGKIAYVDILESDQLADLLEIVWL